MQKQKEQDNLFQICYREGEGKIMKKIMAVVLMGALLLTGCGSSGEDAKKGHEGETLTVLTNSGYPPYEIRNTNGELEGFDIELTETIAKKLGYKDVKWEDIDFDALIGAVNTGKGDMVAAGLSPNEERKKGAELSDSYYNASEDTTNYVLTLKDGDIKETKDIKGKKVGVQLSTIRESTVNEIKDEYELKVDSRQNYAQMVQETKNKRIDFIVVEKAVADEYVEKNDDLATFRLDVGTDSEGNVFAFKKGNTALCEEVNGVIKEMKENGELDKLISKYFDKEK